MDSRLGEVTTAWRGLNKPLWPLLLVALSPIVVAPAIGGILSVLPDCGIDEPWWRLRHFYLALLPGLVDLLPFLWLMSDAGRVRRAATVAGLIGSTRFVLPSVAVALYAGSSGQALDSGCNVSVYFLATVLVPMMLVLWTGSALAIALMVYRSRRDLPPPG